MRAGVGGSSEKCPSYATGGGTYQQQIDACAAAKVAISVCTESAIVKADLAGGSSSLNVNVNQSGCSGGGPAPAPSPGPSSGGKIAGLDETTFIVVMAVTGVAVLTAIGVGLGLGLKKLKKKLPKS